MSFLPVVERELRIACRKRGTYRIRWWTAALGVLISFLVGMSVSVSGGGSQSGAQIFRVLTGCAFGVCLLTGVLLTADSLSQEKREGTLGLLFLTDLKGYDIVLGKFMATSLNAVYALLALMPAIGLSILFGGVTGGEFWRMALALLNALFVSLCAGLAVSAFMRDSQRALGNTIGLLFLLCVALPLLSALLTGPPGQRRPPAMTSVLRLEPGWFSPVLPFHYAQDASFASVPSGFLRSLVASHLVGWFMLALASWRIPRFALEEKRHRTPPVRLLSHPHAASPAESSKARLARTKLLAKSPVLWLIASEPAATWLTWSAVLAWAGTALVGAWATRNSDWVYSGAKVCGFCLKLLIGLQACRFFVQARQDGTLEVLGSTPLTNSDLLRGQWLALQRLFLWPCIILIASLLLPAVDHRPYESMNFIVGHGSRVVMLLWFVLTFAADVVTVTLVGMWLSLSMRRPAFAPAATLLFVVVLPSFLCGMDLVLDILLSLLAWNRLQQDFRYVLAGVR